MPTSSELMDLGPYNFINIWTYDITEHLCVDIFWGIWKPFIDVDLKQEQLLGYVVIFNFCLFWETKIK